MQDLRALVAALRRPRLLVRAARIGVSDYVRERDLCRLTGRSTPPCPASAVRSLLAEEDALEEVRREGTAAYSPARHVEVLIALMAEARALPVVPPVARIT